MANAKQSDNYYEYVSVDTAPSSAGYFTEEVNIREQRKGYVFFSIRGASGSTVVVQYKCEGDSAWTTYKEYTSGDEENRFVIEGGGANVLWRAGIEEGGYSSGTVNLGFDW